MYCFEDQVIEVNALYGTLKCINIKIVIVTAIPGRLFPSF